MLPTHGDVLVIDGGAIVTANAYVAYKYFVSLSSLLALNFESTSFPGSSSDSTNSANSLEAEEEELYITGTEFLDEIQQYDQE